MIKFISLITIYFLRKRKNIIIEVNLQKSIYIKYFNKTDIQVIDGLSLITGSIHFNINKFNIGNTIFYPKFSFYSGVI